MGKVVKMSVIPKERVRERLLFRAAGVPKVESEMRVRSMRSVGSCVFFPLRTRTVSSPRIAFDNDDEDHIGIE